MKETKYTDRKIEDIIESAGKLKQAEVSPFIFTRIKSRLGEKTHTRVYLPLPKAALGLFTLLLLALINFYVVFSPAAENKHSKEVTIGSTVSGSVIPTQSNPYLEILNSQ